MIALSLEVLNASEQPNECNETTLCQFVLPEALHSHCSNLMSHRQNNGVSTSREENAELDKENDSLFGMVSYLLNRISHRYNRNVRSELKAIGLTILDVRTLVSLRVYGLLTINELCVHAIAEQPTMSRALDRLELDGLISRDISEGDARLRVVQLMPKGEALCETIMPVLMGANDEMLAGLKQAERAQLVDLLTRVLKQIRKNPI